MSAEHPIAHTLNELRIMGDYYHPGGRITALRQSIIGPPIAYSQTQIERTLDVTFPPDLIALWQYASSLRLFENVRTGQYGLAITGPDHIIALRREEENYWRGELRHGDLVLGRLIGTLDILLLRCDATAPDFGSVVVALAITHRNEGEWYIAAPSLREFLTRYLETHGAEFWDEDGGPIVTPRI